MLVAKRFVIILLAFMLTFNCPAFLAGGFNLEISAPSYALMQQGTGKILCEKNAHEVRFGTSVTKIMLLLITAEAIDAGKIAQEDIVNISEHAAGVGGANVWLKTGENISVKDLIKSVAMVSANDACIALAEFIGGSEGKFIAMLNTRAKELGMNNTIFKDCIGSDEDGNVTSAYDMAVASSELMEHTIILPYISTWIEHIRDGETQIVNTNKLIKTYQGAMGIKTGTSEKAGSCISAYAQRDGIALIAVVLGAQSSKERFQDVSCLLDYGFANYVAAEAKKPEDLIKKIKVKNGMSREVEVNPQIEGEILIPKGKEREITCEVKIQEEIPAPVKMGDKVGAVLYKLNGETLAEYDVLAEKSVAEKEFHLVFKELLNSFFAL